MASHSLSVRALITLAAGSAEINSPALISSSSKYQRIGTKFSSGDNTVTPSTGTTLVLIIFNSGNGNTYKLKGVGGDTGITIPSTQLLLPFVSGSFVINSSGNDTLEHEMYYL